MMMETMSSDSSEPMLPPDSPGSSVSSRMQEEYEELLKYAVIMPTYDVRDMPHGLSDLRGSFPQYSRAPHVEAEALHQQEDDDTVEEGDEEPEVLNMQLKGVQQIQIHRNTSKDSQSPAASITSEGIAPTLRTAALGDPLATRLFSREHQRLEDGSSVDGSTEQGSEMGEEFNHGLATPNSAVVAFTLSVDQDVAQMDHAMDSWLGSLKKNVMDEFGQAKIKMLQQHRIQLQREKEKHGADHTRVQNELESMKELLHTYEQSIERKDQVISNLTQGLQKQREKYEMLKTFCEWKSRHNDVKREGFATNLAKKHHERSLQQKTWDAWHSVVENRWRARVEKACQAKAQEVCMSLTNDYETKMASLNEALEASRSEVTKLHTERESYEEMMKKAFMRGVCALNLEAMSMFQGEGDERAGTGRSDTGGRDPSDLHFSGAQGDVPGGAPGYGYTVAQEPVYSSDPPGAPPPRVVTSQNAAWSAPGAQSITVQAKGMASRGKPAPAKVISAKVTARQDPRGSTLGSSGTLAPPMSSVMVERHQPVTKQTIGQATASKFPKQQQSYPSQPGIIQRKIAGQAGQGTLTNPNIQTVKLVE